MISRWASSITSVSLADQGSDAPRSTSYGANSNPGGSPVFGDGDPTHVNLASGVNIQRLNLYALKDAPRWRLGAEFGYQQGQTGVRYYQNGLSGGSGERVTTGGLGIATEIEWRPEESSWKFGMKAGYATGSDPTNPNTMISMASYSIATMTSPS